MYVQGKLICELGPPVSQRDQNVLFEKERKSYTTAHFYSALGVRSVPFYCVKTQDSNE